MTTSSSKKRLRAVTWFLAAVLLCLCDWSLAFSTLPVAILILANIGERMKASKALPRTLLKVLRQPSTQYRIGLVLAALLVFMLVWYLLRPIPTSPGVGVETGIVSSGEGTLL